MTEHDRQNRKHAAECRRIAALLQARRDQEALSACGRLEARAARDRFYCLADTCKRIIGGEYLRPDAVVALDAHAAALDPQGDD